MAALAEAVRTARKQKRWGQQELADAAHVSIGVISNLERQITRPQPANERAILDALGIEPPEAPLNNNHPANHRDWPEDVSVILDVVGLMLTSIPEDERPAAIFDLTRWAMNYRTNGPR